MNMSIIHPFMSLFCMKHVIETLQHTVYFMSVVFVYEMISVQHVQLTLVEPS